MFRCRLGWSGPCDWSSAGLAAKRKFVRRDAGDFAAQFAFQDYLSSAGLCHGAAWPREIAAQNLGEYLAMLLFGTIGLMLLDRERGASHDLHRSRAAWAIALRLDCVRQNRRALGRSWFEIFPVWQHGERVHAFWNQLDLWHVGHDRPCHSWAKTRCRTCSASAGGRDRYDVGWLRVQDRRCALSSVGSGRISRSTGSKRRVYRLGLEGGLIRRARKNCADRI